AELPDATRVFPTHGAGSFCAAPPSTSERTSTIAIERASNAALRTDDASTFAREQLDGLPAYPAYYAQMAPINREGARAVRDPGEAPRLDPDEVAEAIDRGAWVVDARE